jgi:glutaredoxin
MIHMYGADWCGDCRRTKSQLNELGVAFDYLDVDAHPEYKAQAIEISGKPNIPVVVFPDDTYLVEPANSELELKLRQLDLIDQA